MARRYARDNRGRFASSGSGATARGGRLKTASGGKRQGQTMKAAGGTAAGTMKGRVKRDPRAMAKRGQGAQGRPLSRSRPPLADRLAKAKSKANEKARQVMDEMRKVDNAKSRNNDVGISPRYQKLIQRGERVDRQARSVSKALGKLKKIDLANDPAKFGFARGSAQRKKMADQIRSARQDLRATRQREEAAARAYRESPVVKYGLTSEIGGNRRQSRKAKQRASSRQTSLVDNYVSASISAKKQAASIQAMRKAAKAQTAATNRAPKRKRPNR